MKSPTRLLSIGLIASTTALANPAFAADTDSASQTPYRAGSQESFEGPAEYFTGTARVEPLFPTNDTASYSGAYVTFEPGARSAWHTHPAGQHIVVTEGVGRTQAWGGPVEEIQAGDAIWCPPGVKHWHGAAPDSEMTHMVVTGSLDGNNVEWMEKVSDDQYNGE